MNMRMLAKTRVYYAGKYYAKGDIIPNVAKKDAHVLLHLDRASVAPVVQKVAKPQAPKPEEPKVEEVKTEEPKSRRPYGRRDIRAEDSVTDPDKKPRRRSSRRDMKVDD